MKQSNNEAMSNAHFESLYPSDSREAEIGQIIGFIKEGNSCQMIGLPGVGRSNLFKLLVYNRSVRLKHFGQNQKWFHFVLIDFSEIRKKPIGDAVKFLFLSLTDSLRERKIKEFEAVNKIFKESLNSNDELVLFQGLKRVIDYLTIEKELTIVFLFDRFEEYVPMLTSEFFSHLRVLRDRAKYRFSVVFSLTHPLEQLLEPNLLSDFYSFLAGHTVFLALKDAPSLEFRLSYLEKSTGKKLAENVKLEILKLTAGHGKMTRICAEEILATSNKQLATSLSLLKFFSENKAVRSVCYEIWNALSPQEQTTLKNLVLQKETDEKIISFLENIGLVKDYKIRIKLFGEFVKYRAQNLTQEKIIFKEETSRILKGEKTLSENLTKGEFKLLKFLIQNTDRIIDRDEIINVVWSDLQSKEGVSDEALDQLIFRLRRKIENNPNNPQHLQTIKGRGVRFMS